MGSLHSQEKNLLPQPENLENRRDQKEKESLKNSHISSFIHLRKNSSNKRNELKKLWKKLIIQIDIIAFKFKLIFTLQFINVSTFIFGQSTVYKFYSILSIYSYFIHSFQNDQAQLIPYHRKRIIFLIFRWKSLKSSSKFSETSLISKLKTLIVMIFLL